MTEEYCAEIWRNPLDKRYDRITGRAVSGSVLKTFCYHVDVYQHMSFRWKWNNSFLKNVP
jgi:hypothetical protein